jgi:hypothetical protein
MGITLTVRTLACMDAAAPLYEFIHDALIVDVCWEADRCKSTENRLKIEDEIQVRAELETCI